MWHQDKTIHDEHVNEIVRIASIPGEHNRCIAALRSALAMSSTSALSDERFRSFIGVPPYRRQHVMPTLYNLNHNNVPPSAVYIGRAFKGLSSEWGNPFRTGKDGTLDIRHSRRQTLQHAATSLRCLSQTTLTDSDRLKTHE
jgi:hypothetical protein